MEVTAFHSDDPLFSHKLRMPNVLASTPECSSGPVPPKLPLRKDGYAS